MIAVYLVHLFHADSVISIVIFRNSERNQLNYLLEVILYTVHVLEFSKLFYCMPFIDRHLSATAVVPKFFHVKDP